MPLVRWAYTTAQRSGNRAGPSQRRIGLLVPRRQRESGVREGCTPPRCAHLLLQPMFSFHCSVRSSACLSSWNLRGRMHATRSGAAGPSPQPVGTRQGSRANARREGHVPIVCVVLHGVRRHVHLVAHLTKCRAALWRPHAVARLRGLRNKHTCHHPHYTAEPAPGPSPPPSLRTVPSFCARS